MYVLFVEVLVWLGVALFDPRLYATCRGGLGELALRVCDLAAYPLVPTETITAIFHTKNCQTKNL